MLDAFLKTRQIVIVQIHVFWLVTVETSSHIYTTVANAADETRHCFEAHIFRDQPRQSEIDKHVPSVSWTQHHILRLDVRMNQMHTVHQSQILIKFFRVDAAGNWLTNFHRKLDAVLVHQKVKAQTGLNFGADLQSGCYFEEGPLLDGSVPPSFPLGGNGNALEGELLPEKVPDVNIGIGSIRANDAVLGVCLADVEDLALEREVTPLDAEHQNFLVDARSVGFDHNLFLKAAVPLVADLISSETILYLLINVFVD
jgi:hypothetical protein